MKIFSTINQIKLILALLLFAALQGKLKAQVTIGSNTAPNSNAVLDLISNDNKGLLLPRVALTSTTSPSPLSVHVAGMLVYNTATSGSAATAVSPGIYYNNGSAWMTTISGINNIYNTDGTLTANRTVTMGGKTLNFTGGNLGIGTNSPADKLHILGNSSKLIIDNGANATSEIGIVFKNGDATASQPKSAIISKGYNNWKRADMYFVLDGAADNGPYDLATDTKMIIKAESGNVGIGTASPSAKLDVAGQIKISGGSPSNGKVLTSDANGLASWTDPYSGINNIYNTDGTLTANRTVTMGGKTLNFTGGNLGIGTSSPNAPLDVYAAANARTSVFARGGDPGFQLGFYNSGLNGAGNVVTKLGMSYNGGTPSSSINFHRGGGTTDSYISFATKNNSTPSMVINGNNVGIGTNSPSAKLDILGGADADGAADPRAMAFQHRTGGFRHWISTRHNGVANNNQNAIDFYLNNSTTVDGSSAPGTGSALGMSVTPTGVGIGTNSPTNKLHILGNSSKLIIDNGANAISEIGIVFKNGDATGSQPKSAIISKGYNVWKQADMYFVLDGAPDDGPYDLTTDTKMIIKAESGNVGIGTASPNYKLHVNGDVGAYTYNCISDIRLKKNIKPAEINNQQVFNIRPVTYTLKEDPEQLTRLGVIAQELETIFPNLVKTDQNGYKAVEYDKISLLLLSVVKQQQKDIEQMKEQLKKLEEKVK